MKADLLISTLQSIEYEQLRIGDSRKKNEPGHIKIEIITNNDDFDALEKEWNELVRESDTHVFQTFEWNRIWWNHFGTNKKLHIVAVYAGNKLAGVAPLFEDDVSLFGRRVYSCLRFLGSYVSQPEGEMLFGTIPYSDYLDCIIHPGYEKKFSKLILRYFKKVNSEFDEIILDEVAEESAIQSIMIPLAVKNNYGLSYKVENASSSPVIQLDSTWKEYLNSMNVKDRYNARRYFKRSVEGDDMVFKIEKFIHAEELPGVQLEFIRLHQQQWNSRGFAGTFSEQRMRDFFMEISTCFYEKGWIEFNRAVPVEADKKCAAVDVIITYNNRIYLMHRGMDEDPLYRKQGPGNVLLYARLNEAINNGVEVFDMLRGSEEFKLRMATKINQNKKITICYGSKTGSVLPGLVKKTMKLVNQFRIEKSHIKLMLKGKSFLRGITEYIQFLSRRIEHKTKKKKGGFDE